MSLNIFSAPANLRYGHFGTNSKIQGNFDPITCGSNWNANCINGMTPKENALLALVYGPNQNAQNAALDRTNLVNGYLCSNCPYQQPNTGWYYMA